MQKVRPQQTKVVKTDSNSSPVKRFATSVHECHRSSEMTILNRCPVSQVWHARETSLLNGVSSQLVTWPTRNQVNLYPGGPLVTTIEKSTRNQSLGYELTFQQFLTKTRTQIYSLSRYLRLYLYSPTSIYVPRVAVFTLCIKCTTRWSKDIILCFN